MSECDSRYVRPTIGILVMETKNIRDNYIQSFNSCLVDSTVKIIESSGGRVVPIWIGQDISYYENILRKINGVFLPGANINTNGADGYFAAAKYIYDIAKCLNDNDDYFPMIGVCAGMQFFIQDITGIERSRLDKRNKFMNYLDLSDDFRESNLFKNATDDILELLRHDGFSYCNRYYYPEEVSRDIKFQQNLRLIATTGRNIDINFIACIEYYRYPFFGIQFNPQNPAFENMGAYNVGYSEKDVKINRYFSDYFVNQCRKNKHRFSDDDELRNTVINNYTPYYNTELSKVYNNYYLFE